MVNDGDRLNVRLSTAAILLWWIEQSNSTQSLHDMELWITKRRIIMKKYNKHAQPSMKIHSIHCNVIITIELSGAITSWTLNHSVHHCGLLESARTWEETGCEFDSWQCWIYTISHVHRAYDYLSPFGVLWVQVHMAWHKNCVKKTLGSHSTTSQRFQRIDASVSILCFRGLSEVLTMWLNLTTITEVAPSLEAGRVCTDLGYTEMIEERPKTSGKIESRLPCCSVIYWVRIYHKRWLPFF